MKASTTQVQILRKALALHDRVTALLDALRQRVDAKRAKVRGKIQAKIDELVDIEYVKQRAIVDEPVKLREELNREHEDLIAYFKAESESILTALREVDSPENQAARQERLSEIYKRIAALRAMAN